MTDEEHEGDANIAFLSKKEGKLSQAAISVMTLSFFGRMYGFFEQRNRANSNDVTAPMNLLRGFWISSPTHHDKGGVPYHTTS